MIQARALPPALTTRPSVNVQSLDLSRLSQSQANGKQIQPGDQLEVSLASGAADESLQPFVVTVAENGTADLPLVGPVRLVGMEPDEAREMVRNASVERGIFRQPTVNVELKSRQMNRVTVLGAVKKPGTYELPAHASDLLSAFVAAEGLTELAGPVVKIQKASPAPLGQYAQNNTQASYGSSSSMPPTTPSVPMEVDLLAAAQGGAIPAIELNDGDVVNVPEVEKRAVYVMGLVKKPERYEIPPGQEITVLDALAMAGGVSESVADHILVIRTLPEQPTPVMIEVSLREAKRNGRENLMLANGDVVTVEETPLTYVVGTIKQIIRVGVNGSISAF
jgi:polysaccharide biosynthesis/export protein